MSDEELIGTDHIPPAIMGLLFTGLGVVKLLRVEELAWLWITLGAFNIVTAVVQFKRKRILISGDCIGIKNGPPLTERQRIEEIKFKISGTILRLLDGSEITIPVSLGRDERKRLQHWINDVIVRRESL